MTGHRPPTWQAITFSFQIENLCCMQSCNPAPLSAKQRQRLTWEAATERLLDAAHIGAGEWPAALARLYDGLTWPLINVAVGARLPF